MVENILWTQWLPSHVILDIQDQEQVQVHVVKGQGFREHGITTHQHVTYVSNCELNISISVGCYEIQKN